MLSGKEINVLVVDDDEDDFLIISEYIKEIKGISLIIDWCNKYEEALEKIRDNNYQIYFVDYRLGGRTGLDLLQAVSGLPSYRPIVLLTGKGNQAIDIEAMKNGATDYLIKSELNTEKLERCMRYSIDRANSLKAIVSSEIKYRTLFESSRDALFISNERLEFTEVNSTACQLFSASREDLLNDNLINFVHPADENHSLRHVFASDRDLKDFELEIIDRDNNVKPCIVSLSWQKDENGNALIHGIIHDITNLRNSEKLNIQTQKLAANERLVRILAHEIRNPLNNISLSADHLKLQSEKEKGLVGIIQRNSTRINQIITELLDSTKPLDLVLENLKIESIIEDSLLIAMDRISLMKIKLTKNFPKISPRILADGPRLKVAFLNILINAIEAMESNKGELTIRIDENNASVSVLIKDNGKGIPNEYLTKLFEPYFTLKKNGMGLGLSSAYSIIQSHEGTINVESRVDQGTSFIIELPKVL